MAGKAFFALLVLLSAIGTHLVTSDVTGSSPLVGTCLCSTVSNLNIRDSPCGNVIEIVDVDVCFRYTGARAYCILNEQYVEFFRIDHGNAQAWVAGEYVRDDPDIGCGTVAEMRLIVIGDWGSHAFQGNDAVAAAMGNWSAVNSPSFIVSTGDNIYPRGISSWDDPQVDVLWRDVYVQEPIRDLVWRMSLGNHDFGEGQGWEWNQVELTQHEPRWFQPYLWYDYVEDVGDHTVHFVVIDSESWRDGINNASTMVGWMEQTLSQSTADWKLVIGHRTVFSSGDHGPTTEDMLQELVPIMERNGVAAYICGHDHNLQHIRNMTGEGMDYVVSGAGGAFLYVYRPANDEYNRGTYSMETAFFEATWGFVALTTRKTELIFDYYSQDNGFLYSFTRSSLPNVS